VLKEYAEDCVIFQHPSSFDCLLIRTRATSGP